MDIHTFLSGDDLTDGQTVAEILERVIRLLEDGTHWHQGTVALDADNNLVKANSPLAVSFSLEGALGRMCNSAGVVSPNILRLMDQLLLEFLGRAEPAGIMNEHDLGWFNDNFDHESIMAFLHEAHRRISC
jgi:hypothetical protein